MRKHECDVDIARIRLISSFHDATELAYHSDSSAFLVALLRSARLHFSREKMASTIVVLADQDPLQISCGCGVHTITVMTARRIRNAGWVLVAFAFLFLVLGIAFAIDLANLDCEKYCEDHYGKGAVCMCIWNHGRIIGFFISAIFSFIGGSLAVHKCNSSLRELRIHKIIERSHQAQTGTLEFQESGNPGDPQAWHPRGSPLRPPDY
ncbi:unnamed protein product [Darwinula stevensoni]|uniref:Uncharacterized protein n=1 Tax=Darwinula stevensoni TaxID=69355 RepID=A0A7R9A2I9_9CRUS|nr:unnamed protein product [Darwinula stevensoni]CAG0889795.1 unnamed protein product [Darwinula stevensoni]